MPTLRHAATLLCAATLLGCSAESAPEVLAPGVLAPQFDASGASSGRSASGHANWINALGEHVSRTFHAREKEDGIVEGNFVQHVTSVEGVRRVNKGDIDCLMLLGPNDAVLSGPVHENVNPALIGMTQIFRVQDNGEGSGDPEDAQSPLFFRDPAANPPINCRNFVPPVVTPIESGNIQVKP